MLQFLKKLSFHQNFENDQLKEDNHSRMVLFYDKHRCRVENIHKVFIARTMQRIL